MFKHLKKFGPFYLAAFTASLWMASCGSEALTVTDNAPPKAETQLEVKQLVSPYGTFVCIVNTYDPRTQPVCFEGK